MRKIKYLIKRVLNLNYKQMLNKINEIHNKTKKSRLFLFFDMIYCGFKYQAGYMDYWLFEMYNLNKKQKETILTRGKNNYLINKYNNKDYVSIFENKDEFLEKFKPFVKRNFLVLNKNNFDEFEIFIKNKDFFIAKPKNGSCGKGIEKVEVTNNHKEMYNYLIDKNLIILEETIKQSEELNKMNPYSINTIRIVTINDSGESYVVASYFRIGNDKKFVDNFNSGGMVVPIEIESGEVIYPALDKKHNLYDIHPVSGCVIKGFKIPNWNKVIKLAKDLSKVVPEVGMVGWDIAITKEGLDIVEGNDYPGHDIYQLPPHRTNGIGVLPNFSKFLK